jgi:hypothetical protein
MAQNHPSKLKMALKGLNDALVLLKPALGYYTVQGVFE